MVPSMTKRTAPKPLDGLTIRSLKTGRPSMVVHATIAGVEFEFTRLAPSSAVEVYDHPTSFEGVPRFVGYLSADAAARLDAIVSRYVESGASYDAQLAARAR